MSESDADWETLECKSNISSPSKMSRRASPVPPKPATSIRAIHTASKPFRAPVQAIARVAPPVAAAAALVGDTSSGTQVDFFRADRIPPPTVFQCSGIISSEQGFSVGKGTPPLNAFSYGTNTYSLTGGPGTAFPNTVGAGTYWWQVVGKMLTIYIGGFLGGTAAFVFSPQSQDLALNGFNYDLLAGAQFQAACPVVTATAAGPLGSVNIRNSTVTINDNQTLPDFQWTASTGNQGWLDFSFNIALA